MPSSIVQGVVEVILQVVLEFACYFIGRVVVPVVSFGRWKCDRITADTPRRKIRAARFYHLRGQQVYLTAEATQLVGVVTVLLFVGGGVLIWYLRRG
jgi:hypothetical protein